MAWLGVFSCDVDCFAHAAHIEDLSYIIGGDMSAEIVDCVWEEYERLDRGILTDRL